MSNATPVSVGESVLCLTLPPVSVGESAVSNTAPCVCR